MALFVNSGRYGMVFDSIGAQALIASDSTSELAVISALEQLGVGSIYAGGAVDYKGMSYMSYFSSVNFDAPTSLGTGHLLVLPGTSPVDLTDAQRAELVRKRCNYYVDLGGKNRVVGGLSFGTFTDAKYGLDWFADALQVAAFDAMDAVPRPTVADVLDALVDTCGRALVNGVVGPGSVKPATAAEIRRVTGNADFDGFLSAGYLVHAVAPTSAQESAARSVFPRVGEGLRGGPLRRYRRFRSSGRLRGRRSGVRG